MSEAHCECSDPNGISDQCPLHLLVDRNEWQKRSEELEAVREDAKKLCDSIIRDTQERTELRELLQSIVADIEAMKCEMPNWYEALDDASKECWFGGFAQGTSDPDPLEYPFVYIQWPNLGILLEQAKKIVN